MSRVGKKPIIVAKGVEIKIDGGMVRTKGPKGQLEFKLHDTVAIKQDKDVLTLSLKENKKEYRRFHGLCRAMVQNMMHGVTVGYSKSLSLVGVGYRAAQKGKGLTLTLGYSHPIDFDPPAGIELKVDKQTTIIVSGADKQKVGQIAATIRGFRPPEPYHGKGVRYVDEQIATKAGKAGGKK